jgi:hypothetical protein
VNLVAGGHQGLDFKATYKGFRLGRGIGGQQ